MAEAATIRIHYGFCSCCAQAVKLQWTLSDEEVATDRGGYWKIIGHFGCRNDGREGKPQKGAKEAFYEMVLRGKAAKIVDKRWPPKISPQPQKVQQLNLFK